MNMQTVENKAGFFSLFKNIGRRGMGMGLLYTVLCLVSCPMVLLLGHMAERNMYNGEYYDAYSADNFNVYLTIGLILLSIVFLVFALVFSTKLFGYMHKKPAVDVFHALPVKRGRLFLTNYLIGALFLLVPIALVFLLCPVFYRGPFNWDFWSAYLMVAGSFLLCALEVFTFCVFFHVTCGTSFGACLYCILLDAGYILSVTILYFSLDGFLPGYTSGDVSFLLLTLFSPMSRMFFTSVPQLMLETSGMLTLNFDWLIHLGVTALLLLLTYFLYQKRKSESAGSSFAFAIPKHITRFIVTTGSAMFFAFIFYSVNPNPFQIFFGAFLGGALTHVVLELIFSKGFGSLLKSIPAFLIFCAVFTAGYFLIATGWFGYDVWMPKAADVASVQVDFEGEYYQYFEGEYYQYNEYEEEEYVSGDSVYIYGQNADAQSRFVVSEPESVETVLGLHKMGVDLLAGKKPYKPASFNDYEYYESTEYDHTITFSYTMKDGRVIHRTHKGYKSFNTEKGRLKLYQSTENQLYLMGLKHWSPKAFNHRIVVSDPTLKTLFTLKGTETKELLACLKEDIQSRKKVTRLTPDAISAPYHVKVYAIAPYDLYEILGWGGSDLTITDFAITQSDFPKTLAYLQSEEVKRPPANTASAAQNKAA